MFKLTATTLTFADITPHQLLVFHHESDAQGLQSKAQVEGFQICYTHGRHQQTSMKCCRQDPLDASETNTKAASSHPKRGEMEEYDRVEATEPSKI